MLDNRHGSVCRGFWRGSEWIEKKMQLHRIFSAFIFLLLQQNGWVLIVLFYSKLKSESVSVIELLLLTQSLIIRRLNKSKARLKLKLSLFAVHCTLSFFICLLFLKTASCTDISWQSDFFWLSTSCDKNRVDADADESLGDTGTLFLNQDYGALLIHVYSVIILEIFISVLWCSSKGTEMSVLREQSNVKLSNECKNIQWKVHIRAHNPLLRQDELKHLLIFLIQKQKKAITFM